MKTIRLTATALLLASLAASAPAADTWPPEGDGSASTWLPTPGSAHTDAGEVDAFLATLSGSFRPMVVWYDGTKIAASRVFRDGKLAAADSTWSCRIESQTVTDAPDALEVRLVFTLERGESKSAGVAAAFDFADWTTSNYVLVPAVLYGGNRFRVLPLDYPPYIHNEKDRPLDMPVTVTNIQRLHPDGSHAKVEMMTGNCSSPMMSFFAPATKRGLVLLSEQQSCFGNNGMFVEEDAKEKKAITFAVAAPCVRERRYHMCGFGPSPDRAVDWKTGDELTLRFQLITFECQDLPAFFDKVFTSRKALTGANTYRQLAPYSHIADLIVELIDKDKWFENEQYGYYCNSADNANKFDNQIGWAGVPIYSYPAALLRTPQRDRRVARSLDMLLEAQGKSGLLYAMLQKGVVHSDTFDDNPATRSVAMVCRTGETLYFGLKQLTLFKARGQSVKPEWETMFRRAADALVTLFGEYGQFGQFVDADTGKIAINGSTAGSVNITALAVASQYFHESQYLAVAEKAGQLYAQRDLAKGYVGGAPAEILQAPDMEASYNLVEAYVILYDLTRDDTWLTRARQAAALLSTWMVSYDYAFPKAANMERVGNKVTGSLFASSQNNHSSPGLYISSGDFLLKLYRATNDRRIAEMYKDTTHNIIQYVNTRTHPLMDDGGVHEGYVTERVQLSDWETNEQIGRLPVDSNMAWESLVALTCLENPGIYLNTTTGDIVVPDHVEVVVESREATGVTLRITNPTPYDAKVAILAESSEQAKKPLAFTACLAWPRVEVKKGETKTVRISPEGSIKSTP